MTIKQLRKMADIFADIECLRNNFLRAGTKGKISDLALLTAAQILEDGKNAMKDKFAQFTTKHKFD